MTQECILFIEAIADEVGLTPTEVALAQQGHVSPALHRVTLFIMHAQRRHLALLKHIKAHILQQQSPCENG